MDNQLSKQWQFFSYGFATAGIFFFYFFGGINSILLFLLVSMAINNNLIYYNEDSVLIFFFLLFCYLGLLLRINFYYWQYFVYYLIDGCVIFFVHDFLQAICFTLFSVFFAINILVIEMFTVWDCPIMLLFFIISNLKKKIEIYDTFCIKLKLNFFLLAHLFICMEGYKCVELLLIFISFFIEMIIQLLKSEKKTKEIILIVSCLLIWIIIHYIENYFLLDFKTKAEINVNCVYYLMILFYKKK